MLGHGLRALRRSPRFALAIIVITGITIASGSTASHLAWAALFDPLPYPHADRLVAIWDSIPAEGHQKMRVSSANYVAWRERQTAFSAIAVLAYSQATLFGPGQPLALRGAEVTGEFFPLLGVRPRLGRVLAPSDFNPSAPDVVILSDALWRRVFHADRSIVGKTVRLDQSQPVVIGVMPAAPMPLTAWASGRLEIKSDAEFYWRPRRLLRISSSGVLGVIARLNPGTSIEQARAQMNGIMSLLQRSGPDSNRRMDAVVVPLEDEAVPPLVRRALWLVAAGAMLLVLLTSANVANLFLLRALDRQRSLAIRAALGASRGALWRLIASELVTLSLAGAALSIPLSVVLMRVLQSMPGVDIPEWTGAGFSLRLPLIAAVLGTGFALLASTGPLLFLRRVSLDAMLRTRGNSVPATLRRARKFLVAGEVALAIVLLVGAVLLGRSLMHIRAVDGGFDASNVLTVRVDLPAYRYSKIGDVTAFWSELRSRLEALPEVSHAGGEYDLPIEANWTQSYAVVGDPEPRSALFRTQTPGAFEAVGMKLVRGRTFSDADRHDAPGVAMINESMAHAVFGARDPMGRELDVYTTQWRWGDAIPKRFRIVGICRDVSFGGLTASSAPAFYLPYAQTPHHEMQLFVRTTAHPAAAIASIRRTLHDLDPQLPIGAIRSLPAVIDDSIARPRLYARLIGGFAVMAALLSMFGLATVLSHSLHEERKNLGIRAALGATRTRIFAGAIATGMRPVIVGLIAGCLLAASTSRVLRGLLFGIEPLSAATYAAVAAGFIVCSMLVCAAPAMRAARVDPMRVLRED